MESQNVVQIVEDYNYIVNNIDQQWGNYADAGPKHIIGLLELAYSIVMIEGDVQDDKSNG